MPRSREQSRSWLPPTDWHAHRQHKNANKRGTGAVAGKQSLDPSPGTLNSILKQAVLKKFGGDA